MKAIIFLLLVVVAWAGFTIYHLQQNLAAAKSMMRVAVYFADGNIEEAIGIVDGLKPWETLSQEHQNLAERICVSFSLFLFNRAREGYEKGENLARARNDLGVGKFYAEASGVAPPEWVPELEAKLGK